MGIWVSDLLSYQRRQVRPKGEKICVRRIQERSKMLQNLGFKGQKIYLEERRHV